MPVLYIKPFHRATGGEMKLIKNDSQYCEFVTESVLQKQYHIANEQKAKEETL